MTQFASHNLLEILSNKNTKISIIRVQPAQHEFLKPAKIAPKSSLWLFFLIRIEAGSTKRKEERRGKGRRGEGKGRGKIIGQKGEFFLSVSLSYLQISVDLIHIRIEPAQHSDQSEGEKEEKEGMWRRERRERRNVEERKKRKKECGFPSFSPLLHSLSRLNPNAQPKEWRRGEKEGMEKRRERRGKK